MSEELVAEFELNTPNIEAEFELSEPNKVDAEFIINAQGTTWGNIEGNIQEQTDLINYVQAESDTINARIDSEVERLEDEIHDATLDIQGSDLIGVDKQEQTVTITSKTFVFEQGIASDTWVIEHNLNKKPSVTVVDTAGTVFTASVEYNSDNVCTVYINGTTKGKAYLN